MPASEELAEPESAIETTSEPEPVPQTTAEPEPEPEPTTTESEIEMNSAFDTGRVPKLEPDGPSPSGD